MRVSSSPFKTKKNFSLLTSFLIWKGGTYLRDITMGNFLDFIRGYGYKPLLLNPTTKILPNLSDCPSGLFFLPSCSSVESFSLTRPFVPVLFISPVPSSHSSLFKVAPSSVVSPSGVVFLYLVPNLLSPLILSTHIP